MNILAFIIAILALTVKNIRIVVKFVLSGITAYWTFHYFFPNIIIYDFKEYNKQEIEEWISSGYAFYSALFTIIWYWIFYWLLRILLINTIKRPVEKYYKKKFFSRMTDSDHRAVKLFIFKLLRFFMRWLKKHGLLNTFFRERDEELELEDEIDEFYFSFSITLHILLCWYILKVYNHYPFYILTIWLVLNGLCTVLIMPAIMRYSEALNKVIEHETSIKE